MYGNRDCCHVVLDGAQRWIYVKDGWIQGVKRCMQPPLTREALVVLAPNSPLKRNGESKDARAIRTRKGKSNVYTKLLKVNRSLFVFFFSKSPQPLCTPSTRQRTQHFSCPSNDSWHATQPTVVCDVSLSPGAQLDISVRPIMPFLQYRAKSSLSPTTHAARRRGK